jgi:hypothetical protein
MHATTPSSDRLWGPRSWVLAGALALPPLAGIVDAREPTHWLALTLLWALGHAALEPEAFRRRFVPDASPAALAGIRIWTCCTLLGYVIVSDLPATARLPREMLAVSAGRSALLHRIPSFSSLQESETVLAAFSAITALSLAAGAAGLLTRVTVPLGALCSFVYVGIFWDYTYFYHQCLIGMYVLAAVSLTPCGDAWSADAWLRKRAGKAAVERPAEVYAWSRYLCWTALALPYFFAGLSKLRNGGWMWWDPLNLRGKVYRDSLQKGIFDPPLGLELFGAPDWMFGAIGVVTLILEVGFFLVLFSPRARRILPLGALSMHLGIFALQNFIFVDALLMQAIFFDWKWARARQVPAGALGSARPLEPMLVTNAALVVCFAWLLRVESYPLSSWAMYSSRRADSAVLYHTTWATHAGRGRIPAPYEKCFPAPTYNPYLRMPAYAFQDAQREDASRKFFLACAEELNRGKPGPERITAFHLEQWLWDWRAQPDGPPYGSLVASREVRVDAGARNVEAAEAP